MRACILEGRKCTAELDRVAPVGQYSFLSAVLTGPEGTREASAALSRSISCSYRRSAIRRAALAGASEPRARL